MAQKPGRWLNDGRPARSGETLYFGYDQISVVEKARRVRRHFDSVAARYDFMNTLLSFGIHHLWKRRAVGQLGLGAGQRVLDVCGGTGDLALLATRRVGPTGQVVLYDINRAMMQVGRRSQRGSSAGRQIVHVQGDAQQIACPDAYFDAVMVGFGIRNVPLMERAFAEMHRVLKPGGRLMCLEFSKPAWSPFRWLYDLYSFYVMPLIGQVIAGSRQAYLHLPESIRTFPLPHQLTARLRQIGFTHVAHTALTNGIAVIHIGRKARTPGGS